MEFRWVRLCKVWTWYAQQQKRANYHRAWIELIYSRNKLAAAAAAEVFTHDKEYDSGHCQFHFLSLIWLQYKLILFLKYIMQSMALRSNAISNE